MLARRQVKDWVLTAPTVLPSGNNRLVSSGAGSTFFPLTCCETHTTLPSNLHRQQIHTHTKKLRSAVLAMINPDGHLPKLPYYSWNRQKLCHFVTFSMLFPVLVWFFFPTVPLCLLCCAASVVSPPPVISLISFPWCLLTCLMAADCLLLHVFVSLLGLTVWILDFLGGTASLF